MRIGNYAECSPVALAGVGWEVPARRFQRRVGAHKSALSAESRQQASAVGLLKQLGFEPARMR
jgi:hypothetical protein